ncbi:MAG: RHS repeat-associated core domain-containing protein [Pirellulaceae bacterium]|nr:RHS repeat-associated core domain-containing protein [Pirellulaceae bacterium]
MDGSWNHYRWNHLYTGREVDFSTGLQYNRNRYLHQQLGIWLSRDPLGYADGPNLYAYYPNVNGVDPWGEELVIATALATSCGVGFAEGMLEGGLKYAMTWDAEEACWAGGCAAAVGCISNMIHTGLAPFYAGSLGLGVLVGCAIEGIASFFQNICAKRFSDTVVTACDLIETIIDAASGCVTGALDHLLDEKLDEVNFLTAKILGLFGFDAGAVALLSSETCSIFGGDKPLFDIADFFGNSPKDKKRQARCTFEAKGYLWDQTTKRTIPCPHPRSAKQCCAKYAGNNFYYWNEIKSARILFS